MNKIPPTSIFDVTGIALAQLNSNGTAIVVSQALALTELVHAGDTIEILETDTTSGQCLCANKGRQFRAWIHEENQRRFLIYLPDTGVDIESEIASLGRLLNQEFISPLDQLTESLLTLITKLQLERSATDNTTPLLQTLYKQANDLRDSALEYWSLLEVNSDVLVSGSERIEPHSLMNEALSSLSRETELFIKLAPDLGIIYGCKRWLVLALQTLARYMLDTGDSNRISCQLQQHGKELVITFQYVGAVPPAGYSSLSYHAVFPFGVEKTLDLEWASRIFQIHGGGIRITSSPHSPRIIATIPTGAPGHTDIHQYSLITKSCISQINQVKAEAENGDTYSRRR